MTTRTASCRCGQLRATAIGEPVRVSACHCLDCQKRSGSAFAVQARWPAAQVTIAGERRTFERTGDSGNRATFTFCPECGSDICYVVEGELGHLIAIPLGAFDDPFFGSPEYSVWESRKHKFVEIVGEADHYD